jgi:Domain of unknown function (DUF4390)
MTDFSTHSCKKWPLDGVHRWLVACAWVLMAAIARAQGGVETVQFSVERADDQIQLSAQLQFELPAAVEDALLKGIPMVFVMNADILRERWYWYDKRIVGAARYFRVAYQPLTRRWRLNVTSGAGASASVGLALNQSYDSLPLALAAIKRVSKWTIADAAELDAAQKYKVEFRFRLDLTQLPRPFQIGMLGENDWEIAVAAQTPLTIEAGK